MLSEPPTCYRHPERRAGVRCQRCERPICPDCMVQASVGFHCPECLRAGRQRVHTARALVAFEPVATYVLIGLSLLGFVAALATVGAIVGITRSEIFEDGALVAAWPTRLGFFFPGVGVAEGEWWRIVTSGFLHDGVIHLGMNMLFLWILGPQLEMVLGRARFVMLYLVSLLAGSLGVLLLDPFAPTLGASGAIFGLLGVAVVVQRSRGIDPWSSGLGGLIVLNLLLTFSIPGISIGGHVGGLIGGLGAGWMVVEMDRRFDSTVATGAVLAALGVAIFGASLWAADYAFVHGRAVL